MISRTLCILLLAAPLAVHAQAEKTMTDKPASPVISDVRSLWRQATDYLVRSATAAPESTYAFRPVASVRTFGQIIGHVAGSQQMFCAMALGEKAPAEDAIEKNATTKAALVQALKESNAYCERAYAQSDAAVAGTIDVFGSPGTRRYVLALNATHDFEHYGNVITYLRMNGMTPPSSQQ